MLGTINTLMVDHYPRNALNFFKIMMRLEYALKAAGFARNQNGSVEVCWDNFANQELGRDFFDQVVKSGMVGTLKGDPPKFQKLSDDNRLYFAPANAVTNVQELIGAVRRVRNNLFHGGKSGIVDHERSELLIEESIYVVEQSLLASGIVRYEFEGLY
jgi:hypothetical protein